MQHIFGLASFAMRILPIVREGKVKSAVLTPLPSSAMTFVHELMSQNVESRLLTLFVHVVLHFRLNPSLQ